MNFARKLHNKLYTVRQIVQITAAIENLSPELGQLEQFIRTWYYHTVRAIGYS